MMNQSQWSQDKALRQWMRGCRLDAFGKMVAELDRTDAGKQDSSSPACGTTRWRRWPTCPG